MNYNQVVKLLHTHFSERKALAMLYKLENATKELAAVGQRIVALSEEFQKRWSPELLVYTRPRSLVGGFVFGLSVLIPETIREG